MPGCRGCFIASTKEPSCTAPLADVPLSRRPSDYFLEQCFISVDPDEYLVADVAKRLGDDNLVVSTDRPHIDAHFPHAIDEFLEINGLSEKTQRENPVG